MQDPVHLCMAQTCNQTIEMHQNAASHVTTQSTRYDPNQRQSLQPEANEIQTKGKLTSFMHHRHFESCFEPLIQEWPLIYSTLRCQMRCNSIMSFDRPRLHTHCPSSSIALSRRWCTHTPSREKIQGPPSWLPVPSPSTAPDLGFKPPQTALPRPSTAQPMSLPYKPFTAPQGLTYWTSCSVRSPRTL